MSNETKTPLEPTTASRLCTAIPLRPGHPRLNATVSLVAALPLALVGAVSLMAHSQAQAAPPVIAGAQTAGRMDIADLVDLVKPAVVSVRVNRLATVVGSEGGSAQQPGAPRGDPLERFFKQFRDQFGEDGTSRKGPQRTQVLGSGFFISADGYVVTNNHVVENAAKVMITLDGARTISAKVIGTDPKTDLALLKVDETGTYPFVPLAASAPRVGEHVVAIGNPFGLGGTVTSGIISARGRDIGAGPYDDFLQIDASVNQGNSGGPTFNLKGEVVGVNTAIYSPSGGSVGIGFAIPSETVQQVVAQLRNGSMIARGYLGVQVQPVTQELADGFGLSSVHGALVDRAEKGTPAANAGLKSGDVIVAVDEAKISDARDLTRRIGAIKPGAKVLITFVREGKEQAVTVTLADLPNAQAVKKDVRAPDHDAVAGLGLWVAPANAVDGASERGVAVVDVDPSGVAAENGIREGDVIVEVGGRSIVKPSDVKVGLDAATTQGRKAVVLKIRSTEGTRFVALPVPKV